MTWGKSFVIALWLLLSTYAAHARDIESFTDSRGILHLTNPGLKKPEEKVSSEKRKIEGKIASSKSKDEDDEGEEEDEDEDNPKKGSLQLGN